MRSEMLNIENPDADGPGSDDPGHDGPEPDGPELAGSELAGSELDGPQPDEPQPDEPQPDEPQPDEPPPAEPGANDPQPMLGPSEPAVSYRHRQTIWLSVLMCAVLGPTGIFLANRAATPMFRAQSAAIDARGPGVLMPTELPAAPRYPLRTQVPLTVGSSYDLIGDPYAVGEAKTIRHPGLPIEIPLPASENWDCHVQSFPGAAYLWRCEVRNEIGYVEFKVSPCAGSCDEADREQARPADFEWPLSSVDDTTWVAANGRDIVYWRASMEHVWQAPAGVMTPDAPAQQLYVAISAFAAGDAQARKILNGIRAGM